MRDIPVFATEFGVASLKLKQIPYTAAAYVTVQDTAQPQEFLDECISFCKMAGAEHIYAAGHPCLEHYPLHTAIVRMTRPLDGLPDTNAALLPVTEQTLEDWRQLYNRRMAGVPNAAYMTQREAIELRERGDGYFVHRGDTLLGIGIAAGDTVHAVASAQPGAGRDTLLALCHALSSDRVVLEVASMNTRALRLYEKLDFLQTAELSRWYQLL